ncbi:oxygen-dependent protoporphyrinogen oxidase [Hymenobacter daecheongensis DSM 21074]|uniref:Coproporphyrinogen III oxidase n=1 Tax=Hymenobacter daecheongensis DSM 21074 TaxID=1121955 RepID=A0A1M6KXD0_9BACT|nr:protoporphyrinogen oxidase [Hymenobacter daecheongensis]SHJ63631.1 oxygen-dependent protoporphyrinogen oxidase [Hymenobacter daecheongensis DSM 21074]
MRVAILGGGISGLTLAFYLQKAGIAYDLFEAGQPGGNIRSQHLDGYLLETGPNSLQLSPELEQLLTDLGLSDQIQDTAAVSQNRYVLRDGRYQRLPGSPPALLASPFFSLKAKWNLLRELTRPTAAPDPLETLAHFFRRRFGPEIVDYALNPFISGIYAGDPEKLLLHKTFPKLAALEQTYGSVLRGLMKSGGAGTRRRIISLQNGLQTITDTLAAQLTSYHGGQAITGISRPAVGQYQVQTAAGTFSETYTALVLALPTYAAAPLLKPLFAEAAAALAEVYYPPMTAVFTAYNRADVAHPLDGFGALHPKAEQPYAAGSIWTSSIYPNRVPAGQVLFTTFVGGTQYEEQARQSPDAQKSAVHAELIRFYGIRAVQPVWQYRYSWERAIPQFDKRIIGAHAAVDALESQGVYAAANWRAGVGVPDCIRQARALAEKISGLPG